MTMTSNLGKRVLKHGFVITTAVFTCTALQAADQTYQSTPTSQSSQSSNSETQKFIQKAAMGGQMEVQMGQLAEQKGQSQQVKDLGATLVRDHTAANQQLQQLAAAEHITLDSSAIDANAPHHAHASADTSASTETSGTTHSADLHANMKSDKEHRELAKLENQSGTEFDKAFVRMAIKDHKKDISEFERARTEVTDPQVTSFIDQTLPKLRNHLQMAERAAKAVGLNEASITSDREDESTTSAAGAAATSDVGTRGSDRPSSPASNPANDRQSSSYSGGERYNGRTDADASGTVQHNTTPQADLNANVGDHSVSASADKSSADYSSSTDTAKKHKIFSTDKNDGKFLGIIPDPFNKDQHKGPSAGANVDVNGNSASVGASAGSETSSSSSQK